MRPVKVIIFNGVGSVGKSSAAKALQSIASDPVLHVAGDAFLGMLPAKMMDHPAGIVVERIGSAIDIRMGEVVHRILRGMRAAVAALAAQENNLIVDDIMLNAADQLDYRERLHGHEVYFIGLFAPLEVLEKREHARGDRLIGLAKWQYDRVHRGICYDLEIDTSQASPEECARQIALTVGL